MLFHQIYINEHERSDKAGGWVGDYEMSLTPTPTLLTSHLTLIHSPPPVHPNVLVSQPLLSSLHSLTQYNSRNLSLAHSLIRLIAPVPINFAACWNDESSPPNYIGVKAEIAAPRLLLPPICFVEYNQVGYREACMLPVCSKRTLQLFAN